MDVGLESAGFEHVGLIEIGTRQRETLRANMGATLLDGGDVNELAETLTPRDLGLSVGELELLAGGPPCQPFSMAAQWAAAGRQGMLDPRARTVESTLTLVRKFLPRAVLFENVRGFVQGPGSAIEFLREEFSRISRETGANYTLDFRILNAADYGVPQNRRRAIVVALRDGVELSWPDRTHVDSPLSAGDALAGVSLDETPLARGKWVDLLPSIPEGKNYLWLTSRGGGPEVFGYRTKYWNFLLKLARDLPAWTLSASPGPSTGPFHWENRPLAVEEQARLQSFPDYWRFSGNFRDQTLQVGNATPPLLAEVMGLAIRRSFNEPSVPGPALVRQRIGGSELTSAKVAPLPERFTHLVGKKQPHAGEGNGPAPRAATALASADAG